MDSNEVEIPMEGHSVECPSVVVEIDAAQPPSSRYFYVSLENISSATPCGTVALCASSGPDLLQKAKRVYGIHDRMDGPCIQVWSVSQRVDTLERIPNEIEFVFLRALTRRPSQRPVIA